MSGYACSNFTGLIRLLQVLPTITNLDINNTSEFSSADFDKFVRAWFWGAVIVIATVALLYATFFYYCCVCCCYCCGDRAEEEKPVKLRVCCGCIAILVVFLMLALGGVIIWMEIRFDNGIMQNYLGIESVMNTTDITESNVSTSVTAVLDLREFERIRHYSSLSWIGLVLIILILSFLIFTFVPLCKSQAVVNVCIGTFAVTSFLSSVYVGVLFAYLISLSDQCLDINLQLTDSCINGSSVNITLIQFDSLCNVASQCGFILLMLGCGLILFFILIQMVAAQYAGSLTRSKYKYVEYSEIVISAPISATGPGVWGAYGTQALLGTTSQGQTIPQTQPRNPLISSSMQQYMLHHSESDNGMPPSHYSRQQSQTSYDHRYSSEATNSYDLTTSHDTATAF